MIYNIACEQNFISKQASPPLQIPIQQLAFAGVDHHWQDIVLGIFNPLVITAVMRTKLMSDQNVAETFDEMRNEFNYRYEFASTTLKDVSVMRDDKALLTQLGVEFI